ncbi:MAG: hypothetical protein K8H75_15680 [Sulfuricella sp.]|jgi:hypothetical protein|nr:hypothetical protein [Sulfuricella sp.]
MTTTNPKTAGNYEQGYKPVLVRQETKEHLRKLRATLPDRDLCQERRLATAALELMLEQADKCPETRERMLERVHDIVRRDLEIRAQV